MDIDAMLPPPGEESFTVSHAGDEVALYKELEQMTMGQPRRVDTRNCSECIAHQVADWASQYDDLTDALLRYKADYEHPPLSDDASENFSIEVVDILGISVSPFVNVSLLHHGCIGSSPIHPTTAITIRILEVYRQSHRVCPHFSIQAQAKMLCALHNVYFHRHLAEQLRVAYDVYLELNRHLNSRLDKFLGRDMDNWSILNSCPACQYSLVDEPPLELSFLCALDGNNSAKLVDPAIRSGEERPDPRSRTSSIWLTESYVDQFKDKVRSARARQGQGWPASSDSDDPWIDEHNSNDSAEPPSVCVDCWCNAAPQSCKKMFAIFKQSGIFVTVCRHGFLLTIYDMVRSGDLYAF
ncbi:hypothetical protein P692DRAFT_201836751 [Suillus brevipes Sb2]|nr:hypothetical protein P692DRAFT_201836751 [Suillus brevipes Sb2]